MSLSLQSTVHVTECAHTLEKVTDTVRAHNLSLTKTLFLWFELQPVTTSPLKKKFEFSYIGKNYIGSVVYVAVCVFPEDSITCNFLEFARISIGLSFSAQQSFPDVSSVTS